MKVGESEGGGGGTTEYSTGCAFLQVVMPLRGILAFQRGVNLDAQEQWTGLAILLKKLCQV